MKQISGIDLYYLTQEFQGLISGKVDKVYQIDKKDLLINIHVPKVGKKSLRVMVPSPIYITEKRPKTPENPPGFCMFLRKRLGNARIRNIEQVGLERILKIVFETKETKYNMYIELFSKGNVILTDENNKIIQPLERQIWKDRKVQTKEDYILPASKMNPIEITEKELTDMLAKSRKDKLVTFLAVDLSFGGKYSEELCKDLEKDVKPKEFKQIKELHKRIKSIFSAKKSSLSKEIDIALEVEEQAKQDVEPKKITKQKEVIKNQEEHIKKLEKDSVIYNQIGESIYNNYSEIEKIIKQLNQAMETMPVKDIKKKLTNKKILDINAKQKTILLDLSIN